MLQRVIFIVTFIAFVCAGATLSGALGGIMRAGVSEIEATVSESTRRGSDGDPVTEYAYLWKGVSKEGYNSSLHHAGEQVTLEVYADGTLVGLSDLAAFPVYFYITVGVLFGTLGYLAVYALSGYEQAVYHITRSRMRKHLLREEAH